MTPFRSPARMSSRRTGPLPPRRRRRAGLVLVAVLGLALGVVAPGVALTTAPAARAADPVPTATAESDESVHIALAPDARGTYAPGSPLAATVSIRNDGTERTSSGSVRLDIGRTALPDRAAVTAWLDDESSPALAAIGVAEAPAVAGGETGTAAVTVPATEVGALGPGVYPLRATWEPSTTDASASASVVSRSVIVVARGARPAVSAVVPFTASPAGTASGSLLSAEELATLTAPGGSLSAQLDAASGTTAILAVDPAIPAAIRVLGTTAPPTAVAWLDRLLSLPNERFRLQFGDADTAAQAAAGLTAPLAVDTLTPFLSDRQPSPAPSMSPSSTGTASPSASPVAPVPTETAGTGATVDYAALTDIGTAQPALLWPRGEVSGADVAVLSRYADPAAPGIATTTILPSTSATSGVDGAPVAARGVVDRAGVLTTDTAVSDALSRASAEKDPVRRGAPLAEAEAMLWFADPAAPVLVGLDRNASRPGDGLSAALASVAAGPRGPSLSELLATAAVPLTLTSGAAADRAAAVTAALEDERQIAAFSSILEDPTQLTVRQRISILRLLAVGENADASSFALAAADQRAATRKTLDAVGIQPSNPILISAAVDVPIWLRNDLPYPVNVVMEVQPSDGRLAVERFVEAKGQPRSTNRLKIPVESRVATAEVDLRLSLTSPTGVPVGTPQTARLTVHAEWESIGLLVLGGIAALLIGGGVIRTILRRRAADRVHADEGMEPGDADETPVRTDDKDDR
ncbi:MULTISPECIES: DUF6049 family protein [Bacteria]|uniref:DUF6049 family protein n=1 Tax=Bacteria TaxID=2 RepID=UPI003C7B285D